MSDIDWNEYATNYDSLNSLEPYREMLAEVVGVIWHSKPSAILDAGCGTGNLLVRLTASYIPTLVGMDSSTEMLAHAEKKCPSVQFVQAELNTELPFEKNAFDAIACVNALYAVKDPNKTLAEFARILKRDGVLTIVTPKQNYDNGLILKTHCGSTKPDEYWRNLHSDLAREELLMREALQDEVTFQKMRRVVDVNRRISTNMRFHFFTGPELRDAVQLAGFSVIDLRETYARQSHLLIARRT
ncbi:class I SAM-dependent methyltransferase [Patescibacteria group bacterium]|nr:class I SAM-dependent methyltransferase [Patescibacteria group bacterium]